MNEHEDDTLPVTGSSVDNNPILSTIKNAISSAIAAYKTQYPRRAQSVHRQKNMVDITAICDKAVNADALLETLEDYFSSDAYYTGLLDQSALEDLIAYAIITVDKNLNRGLNAFGYAPSRHPVMEDTPPGANDDTLTLTYTLNDFINYAMDKYSCEKEGLPPQYRIDDLARIHQILQNNLSDHDKALEIKSYINSNAFRHSYNSVLKKYLLAALHHAHHGSKNVAIRTWEATDLSGPAKIMIYLHGWHDSVNSGDKLAQEAVKHGFTVIAYDHRGHGKDAERHERNIPTDLLRIDFRNFLAHLQREYPNADLALVGHSMGAAILTSENKFIRAQPAVKSVTLLAPAVMSGLGKMISPVKMFYRNMHQEVQIAQRASNRFGGNGPSLFSLLNFMRKTFKALTDLFSRCEIQQHPRWNIYLGKKDASVNYSEFVSLPHQDHITFFPRADHALQFGRHAGSVNRKIIADIEQSMSRPGTSLHYSVR